MATKEEDKNRIKHEDKPLKGAFPVTRRARKSSGQSYGSFDLDLTPMMNVFMILLPFLVSMAVFTHLAVVEFSLPPAAGTGGGDEQTKELDISVVITPNGFQIVGTGKKLDMVPKTQGEFQFQQLRALLSAIKFQYPSQKSVILVFDGEVLYDDIIKFMDICRESQFPDIGLSGDIG
ncbi:MAG: biopolymer transporter ExbD [Chitinispirillaceae bacterium]|jgi:biopolymer transport protein ExbD|nr:biopolymer transporter ExbD [Chitinispirillaceae bacterium]